MENHNNSPFDSQKFEIEHVKVEQPEDDEYPQQEIQQTEPNTNEKIEIEVNPYIVGVSNYECEFCQQIFTDKSTLDSHTNKHHRNVGKSDKKPFRCRESTCKKSFKTRKDLKQHLRSHSDEKPFRCEESGCDKSFKIKTHLTQHMLVHSEERPIKCQFPGCSKTLKSQYNLKRHMGLHSDAYPYQCKERGCLRAFKTQSYLNQHKRVHTDQKPFVCNQSGCSKSFKLKGQLKVHLLVHSVEKPVKCEFPGCSQYFKANYNLKLHMKTHSDDKPFECPHFGCLKTFKSRFGFRKHLKTHGGVSGDTSEYGGVGTDSVAFESGRELEGEESIVGSEASSRVDSEVGGGLENVCVWIKREDASSDEEGELEKEEDDGTTDV